MNEKAWKNFEKTGSVADYLSYKLGCENEAHGSVFAGATELRHKKFYRSTEKPKNADKDKGNSSAGTGLQ